MIVSVLICGYIRRHRHCKLTYPVYEEPIQTPDKCKGMPLSGSLVESTSSVSLTIAPNSQ